LIAFFPGTVISPQPQRHWYFGWNVVAACSILTLFTVGLRLGVGPLFLPIATDLGFTRSTLSAVIAVGMLFYGIGMPLGGYLVKVLHTRAVVLLGAVCVLTALLWTVNTTSIVGFIFAFGILLSIGLSFISPTAFAPLVLRWFVKKRGAAVFYLSTGGVAGIAVITPLLNFMVENLGWRNSLILYGIGLASLTTLMGIFIIREPRASDGDEDTSQTLVNTPRKDNRTPSSPSPSVPHYTAIQAIKTRPFWIIVIGMLASGYSINLLGVHGVPMLVDHGFSPMMASAGIGVIGITGIISTIVLSQLADRVQRRKLLATIYFIRAVGFVGLLLATTDLQLIIVAIIGGSVWAGNVAMATAILADLYGVRLVGLLFGWTYLGHQIVGMISSWLGGWAYEQLHTHWPVFGFGALSLVVAAYYSWILPNTNHTAPKAVR